MPNSKYDARDLVKHIAEGNADGVMRERAAYKTPDPQYPTFLRFVVLDVIHDPAMVDSIKLSHYVHDLGLANSQYAVVAPRNSIIARRVMGGDSTASEKVMVLYPFCPPHLAMPAKPGEHVWGMLEHPDAKTNDIGYWMWKITQPSFVEDVNYTHADRQHDASFIPGLSDVFEGTANPKYEFHNGAVDSDQSSGNPYVIADTATLNGDPMAMGTKDADKAYTDILQNADAAKIAQYESIPRYRKRPQDIAFEGTNNTLIVLGTDRTGAASDYTTDPNKGQIPKAVSTDTAGGGAGAIDLVVGRGQTSDTGGKPVSNSLNNKELGKDKANLQPKEGDVDLINDRSRVLISQKTKPDTNFNLAPVIAAHATIKTISDGTGEGAIVIKTDKIRLVARQDVVIMVTQNAPTDSAAPPDANGNVKDPGTLTPTNCASIIIRTNGDIIFTPAMNGVVKLGGDDANLAVLCQKAATGAADGSGMVTAPPIIDTMFGSQGVGGVAGQFATRVVLK